MGLFDFFTKRRKPASPAAMAGDGQRRPLLIMLEFYILSAIGHLPADDEQLAASATQAAFGGGADWKATLRSTLKLKDSMDDSLRQMWATNQERAQQAGITLTPGEFARRVTDQNFAHLLN